MKGEVIRVGQVDIRFLLEQAEDGLTVLSGLVHQIENVGSEDTEMSLSYSSGTGGMSLSNDQDHGVIDTKKSGVEIRSSLAKRNAEKPSRQSK